MNKRAAWEMPTSISPAHGDITESTCHDPTLCRFPGPAHHLTGIRIPQVHSRRPADWSSPSARAIVPGLTANENLGVWHRRNDNRHQRRRRGGTRGNDAPTDEQPC